MPSQALRVRNLQARAGAALPRGQIITREPAHATEQRQRNIKSIVCLDWLVLPQPATGNGNVTGRDKTPRVVCGRRRLEPADTRGSRTRASLEQRESSLRLDLPSS